jgi:hypothetical protein
VLAVAIAKLLLFPWGSLALDSRACYHVVVVVACAHVVEPVLCGVGLVAGLGCSCPVWGMGMGWLVGRLFLLLSSILLVYLKFGFESAFVIDFVSRGCVGLAISNTS